jgi:hypothetical protein
MLRSKAIKEEASLKKAWTPRKKSETVLGKVYEAIREFVLFKIYYPPIDLFRRHKERIGRSLAYAKFGWLHYDFDSAFLYDLLAFKMKRLYDCLENGHAIQEDEDMAALKEAIQICERLHEDNYDDKYHEAHSAKWGEIESKYIPNYDSKGKILNYTWETWRKGTVNVSEEVKEQETKEFRECFEKGEADRKADIDRLAHLLKEHSSMWWY